MERDELYSIVDTILNKASDADVEVIVEALKRRQQGGAGPSKGFNFSPERTARQAANSIQEQISYSQESVREMVRGFAVDIIRKQAPELSEEQVNELLQEWIPNEEEKRRRAQQVSLPPDVLITMTQQFISYSEGTMPASEQMQLEHEIPEWYKTYWERFPLAVRDAISLYLKGKIDKESFWAQVTDSIDTADAPQNPPSGGQDPGEGRGGHSRGGHDPRGGAQGLVDDERGGSRGRGS
jgi:hypothetical protein